MRQAKVLDEAVKEIERIKICDLISKEYVLKEFGRIGREHCIANKLLPKRVIAKMSDQECAWLMNQHTRAFLGMDKPNIFTK